MYEEIGNNLNNLNVKPVLPLQSRWVAKTGVSFVQVISNNLNAGCTTLCAAVVCLPHNTEG